MNDWELSVKILLNSIFSELKEIKYEFKVMRNELLEIKKQTKKGGKDEDNSKDKRG